MAGLRPGQPRKHSKAQRRTAADAVPSIDDTHYWVAPSKPGDDGGE